MLPPFTREKDFWHGVMIFSKSLLFYFTPMFHFTPTSIPFYPKNQKKYLKIWRMVLWGGCVLFVCLKVNGHAPSHPQLSFRLTIIHPNGIIAKWYSNLIDGSLMWILFKLFEYASWCFISMSWSSIYGTDIYGTDLHNSEN